MTSFFIQGPSETPYEGGIFQLAFSVPEQYPLQPPQVRFLTKIFHPNVHFKVSIFITFLVYFLVQYPPPGSEYRKEEYHYRFVVFITISRCICGWYFEFGLTVPRIDHCGILVIERS